MKKIVSLFFTLLLTGTVNVYSQGVMDAYKYSQSDLHGTARFSSMGGAFGALGGDISSMTTNPAGIGIYKSSEVVATLNLASIKTQSNLLGSKVDQSKTKFNFDNLAYIGYFPTGNYSGIKGWNVGIAYNRVKNFARNYKTSGKPANSLSDYIAAITNDLAINNSDYTGENLWLTDNYNPFNEYLNPLSVAGYSGGLIGTNYPKEKGGFFNPFSKIKSADMRIVEKGAIDQYDFSLATNISDILFLGATFVVTDIDYSYQSMYAEDFEKGDYSDLENTLSTEGNGYSFNIGAIVRPIDYLRLGVAYNSPTWYDLTDYSALKAGSDIPGSSLIEPVYSVGVPIEYKLRTNDRWIFSAAGIFGQYALISVDYELSNYKNLKMSDPNGFEYDDNSLVKSYFGTSGTLRVGTEAKITPQFAVRAGGSWTNSPVKTEIKKGEREVMTAGSIPHYVIDKGVSNYTIGFGYRFTPRFYTDVACVYKIRNEDVYSFSSIYDPELDKVVVSSPAKMKTKTTRVALTLGYKF